MSFACRVCLAVTSSPTRLCDTHRPAYASPRAAHAAGHRSSWRNRSAQHRFRQALIQRSGGRCEWPDGCTERTKLEAHHTIPGNDDPDTGLLLCERHHKEIDPYA